MTLFSDFSRSVREEASIQKLVKKHPATKLEPRVLLLFVILKRKNCEMCSYVEPAQLFARIIGVEKL